MVKQISFNSINEGSELAVLDKGPITHGQIIRYAGASGDFNPIHNDPVFAKKQGLDSTIAHGMLIMGMVGQLITNISDSKYVANFNIRFGRMTKQGDSLKISAQVKKKTATPEKKTAICTFQVVGQNGDRKAKGEFTLLCS